MTVRVGGADIVLDSLCAACYRIIHMAAENFMKLQDVVLRNGNGIEALMNDSKNISILGYFLLVTVLRRRLFFNKLPDSRIRCNNTLDGVRCLGTLYLGNFHELFKFFRALL